MTRERPVATGEGERRRPRAGEEGVNDNWPFNATNSRSICLAASISRVAARICFSISLMVSISEDLAYMKEILKQRTFIASASKTMLERAVSDINHVAFSALSESDSENG